jgi:hypothetical protein
VIEKQLSANPEKVLVTFRLDRSIWADDINLAGEFNNWNPRATRLMRSSLDPDWHVTLELDTCRRYRFTYIVDGNEWNVEGHADGYLLNASGNVECVVDTHPSIPIRPPDRRSIPPLTVPTPAHEEAMH